MIDSVHPDGIERLIDAEDELQDAAQAFASADNQDAERAAWRRLRLAAMGYMAALTVLEDGYPKDGR